MSINYPDFGLRIRALRLLKGMTQVELAKLSILPPHRISHLEGGRSTARPTLCDVRKLSIALNTTSDYLLGLKND